MVKAKVNNKTYNVDLENDLKGTINSQDFNLSIKSEGENNFSVVKNGVEFDVDVISVNSEDKSIQVMVNGRVFDISLEDKFDTLVRELGVKNKINNSDKSIKAQMPGLVVEVSVTNGEVIAGEKLITLEAMKMENVIKAPSDLIIKKVLVKEGDTVEKNDVLFEIE